MKKGIVDRFEGLYVIVEFEEGLEKIESKLFPPNVKEGDVVVVDGKQILVDEEESQKRCQWMKGLADKLFE